MPVLGIIASQISGHLFAPSGAYDSIATVTVGSGGLASIDFTSIPSTYTHLQVRGIGRSSATASTIDPLFRLNSDTGSNYRWHDLSGDGATASAYAPPSTSTYGDIAGWTPLNTATAGIFSSHILDILDYANTNKYKTARSLGGMDLNGSGGLISLRSSLWMNTNAVTSISIFPSSGSWVQYSSFALYGIRGN